MFKNLYHPSKSSFDEHLERLATNQIEEDALSKIERNIHHFSHDKHVQGSLKTAIAIVEYLYEFYQNLFELKLKTTLVTLQECSRRLRKHI